MYGNWERCLNTAVLDGEAFGTLDLSLAEARASLASLMVEVMMFGSLIGITMVFICEDLL